MSAPAPLMELLAGHLAWRQLPATVTDGQPRPTSRTSPSSTEPHQLLQQREVARLSLDDVVERQVAGVTVLDVRPAEAFARGHLRASVNVGLEGCFAEYAADVIDPGAAIVVSEMVR